ncbi:MAG: cupin domain-containing protein [Candidatus Aenigmatarchaeota archaeon]
MIDMSFELYKIPQGKILIAFSDKKLSVGTMELNPKQETAKHNRPVLESLFQLKGKCIMKLFVDGGNREVVLNEGDSLDIPPKAFHTHSNPYDKTSLTFWKASGDITEIIDNIRKTSRM